MACSPQTQLNRIKNTLPSAVQREVADIDNLKDLKAKLLELRNKRQQALQKSYSTPVGKVAAQELQQAKDAQQKKAELKLIELLSQSEKDQLNAGELQEEQDQSFQAKREEAEAILDFLKGVDDEAIRTRAENTEANFKEKIVAAVQFQIEVAKDRYLESDDGKKAKKDFIKAYNRVQGLYTRYRASVLRGLVQANPEIKDAANALLAYMHEPSVIRSKKASEQIDNYIESLQNTPDTAAPAVLDDTFAYFAEKGGNPEIFLTAGKFNLSSLAAEKRVGSEYAGKKELRTPGLQGGVWKRFKNSGSFLGKIPNFFEYLKDPGNFNKVWEKLDPDLKKNKARLGFKKFNSLRNQVDTILHDEILPGEQEWLDPKNTKSLEQRMREEPLHYFRNTATDSRLDSNFVTAMTLELTNVVGMAGKSFNFNLDKDIERILGVSDLSSVPRNVVNQLRTSGVLRRTIANELGERILKNMNLEFEGDNFDGFFQERLAVSLGEAAIAVGYKMGVFEDGLRVETSKFQKWRDGNFKIEKDDTDADVDQGMTVFIKLPEVKEELTEPVQNLADIFKDTRKIFDSWFNSNTTERDYRTTPAPVNSNVKRTPMKVGETREKGIEAANNQEYEVLQNFKDQYDKFGRNDVREWMGYKDPSTVHKSKRDSQEGINRDIERRLDALEDLYDEYGAAVANDKEYPVYLEQRVVANLRQMVNSNTIDYQNSKSLHRWTIGLKGWGLEIDVTKPNLEDMDHYEGVMLSIGWGLGVGIDDTPRAEAIQETKDLLAENKEAIDIIKAKLNSPDKYTFDEKRVLQKAIKSGGEKGHTFMALDAYARLEHARETGTPYKHTLAIEVDGKTNGAAFSFIQISPDAEAYHLRLNQTGMFTEDDTVQEYADAKAQGHGFQDLYQSTLSVANKEHKSKIDGTKFQKDWVNSWTQQNKPSYSESTLKYLIGIKKDLQAILYAKYTDQFLAKFFRNGKNGEKIASALGRNLMKDIAMQVGIYAAGLESAKKTITFGSNRANILDWVYSEIEARANPTEDMDLDTILENVAQFINQFVIETVQPFRGNEQEIYNFFHNEVFAHPDVKEFVELQAKTKAIGYPKWKPLEFLDPKKTPKEFVYGLLHEKKGTADIDIRNNLNSKPLTKEDIRKILSDTNKGMKITAENVGRAVLEMDLNDMKPTAKTSTKVEDVFIERVGNGVGQSTYDGLVSKEGLGEMIDTRTAFLNSAIYMNNVYTALFESMRAERTEQNGEPLSLQQEQDIKDELLSLGLYPSVAHYGTGKLADGSPNPREMLDLTEDAYQDLDEKTVAQEGDYNYAQLRFAEGTQVDTGKEKLNSLKHHTRRKRPDLDIGVKAFVLMVHSMDAAWITDILKHFQDKGIGVAHIFDALLMSPEHFEEIGRYANERFIKMNAEFSIMGSMQQRLDHFENVIKTNPDIRKRLAEDISPEKIESYGGEVNAILDIYGNSQYATEIPKGASINGLNPDRDRELIYPFKKQHEKAELARQIALSEITMVGQAMLPGTAYPVTPEDRASFPNDMLKEKRKTTSLFSPGARVREEQIKNEWTEKLTAVNATKVLDTIEDIETVKISPEHDARLNEAWDQIIIPGLNLVDKVIDTRFAQIRGTENAGEFITDGKDKSVLIAAAENAASSPVPLSVKEVAAHEYLHAIFLHFFNDPKNFSYREAAERLYERAREVVKPAHFLPKGKDWGDATEAEKRVAQKRWDHIFANTEGALDEFIAMARTNEQLIDILKDTTLGWDQGKKSQSFLKDPIKFVWNLVVNALGWLTEQRVRLRNGQSVYSNLDQLLKDIVQINHTQKETLATKVDSAYSKIHTKANEAASKAMYVGAREALKAFSKLRGKDKKGRKFSLDMETPLEQEKFEEYIQIPLNFINDFLGEATDNKQIEILNNLKKELLGLNKNDAAWRDRLIQVKKDLDQMRKNIRENITSSLAEFFDPKNPLTRAEQQAATDVLLKTDLSALMENGYSLDQIRNLLKNRRELEGEIGKLRRQIDSDFDWRAANWMKNQAEGLGIFTALGRVAHRGQMTNAHDIVAQQILNEDHRVEIPDTEFAEQLVDQLASLEALRHVSAEKRNTIADVIDRESRKPEGANGVQVVLAYHSAFKQKSLEENFGGSKIGTHKGYTKESFNPDAQVAIAVDSPQQEKIMRKKGFKKQKSLTRDPLHKGKRLALYSSNIGLNRMNAGVISLTGERFKGSSILDGLNAVADTPMNAGMAKNEVGQLTRQMQLEARRMMNGRVEPNLDIPYLLPVLNQKTGEVVNHRYVMDLETKDDLLGRDDRVFETMGNMYASIHDKKITPELNELALDRLEKDWVKFKDTKKPTIAGSKKYDWVILSKNNPNAKEREIYRMLPDSMKYAAEKYFPNGEIPIRKDLVNYIFGFRDVSITGAAKALNTLLPKDTSLPYPVLMSINMGDRILREVMQLARVHESITVPAVTVGNLLSNNILLLADGVPPAYIMKNFGTAIIGMRKYQKARGELIKLEAQLLAKQGNLKEIQGRIQYLQESMARNPVHELVQEGLFPAIVEDINVSALTMRDNRYIGKWRETGVELARKYNAEWAVTTAQELSMMPGSKMFAFATAMNQYGDFVARYTQYKYNTEHRGMNKRDAVHTALTDFVYYEEPTDPRIKALNDYGMWMFSKFFLRIQRVYAKLLYEKPGSIAALSLVESMGVNLDNVWIGDYFMNLPKAWNRLNLLPADRLGSAVGMPAFSWLNPFAYAPG